MAQRLFWRRRLASSGFSFPSGPSRVGFGWFSVGWDGVEVVGVNEVCRDCVVVVVGNDGGGRNVGFWYVDVLH